MNKNFWCADPAAAAAALRAQYPRAAERACAIADDVCANRFLFRDHWEMERTNVPVQFGPEEKDIDWALIPAGDPEWIYAMNRHTSFVNLARAWLLTGDERYAQKYARLIEDWIDRVPLTGESRNDTWRSLEAGLRCENWLRALELLAGSGVPGAALRQKIETCLRQHGGYLAAASNTFHRLSNWGVLQDHGLFLLGVYFDRADWRQLALSRLDENLHHAVFGDGSQWEQSPMYHCEVLHNALDVVLVGRKAGVPLPAPFTDAVHRMCRALAAWVKPDGRLPMQSDSDDMAARDLRAAGALFDARIHRFVDKIRVAELAEHRREKGQPVARDPDENEREQAGEHARRDRGRIRPDSGVRHVRRRNGEQQENEQRAAEPGRGKQKRADVEIAEQQHGEREQLLRQRVPPLLRNHRLRRGLHIGQAVIHADPLLSRRRGTQGCPPPCSPALCRSRRAWRSGWPSPCCSSKSRGWPA